MKKKLLLIGNKPLNKNYADKIKEYDFVVRINRMTNFHQTEGKCDLWLADIHESALDYFREENSSKFINSKNAIVFKHSQKTSNIYLSEIKYNGNIHIIDFDDIPINKYIGVYRYNKTGMCITNVIWMLIYCLENFLNNYEIHILGVSGRLFLNSPIHKYHNKIYKAEEYFVNSLIDKKIITCIDEYSKIENITKNNKGYTGNIPLFSSFWHSDTNILPKIVIASINSFVKNGCPYHLYTYKKYINVPNGCIVKNANEILDYSNFFMGSRNDYASFSDMFRIYLINKIDTAWTDTDNFFITDDFPTKTVLISQDNRIQNSFFYIENTIKGIEFKKKLLEFYENPGIIQDYDNKEMIDAKSDIIKYNNKIKQLSNAKWGIGGSCLFSNINEIINMEKYLYDYYKYFNSFHFSEQFQLWIYPEEEYMNYFNKDVKILVMSMALLQRNPYILAEYNKNSYIGNLFNKYE